MLRQVSPPPKEDLQKFPELVSMGADVDVAENLAFQAFRQLATVLPLYLHQARWRISPVFIIIFQSVDTLSTQTLTDGTRNTLRPDTHAPSQRPYTLLDLLFAALRLFSEDGLRGLFLVENPQVLRSVVSNTIADDKANVSIKSCQPRRRHWPTMSSRSYSSAIKAQRRIQDSPPS